MILNQPLGRGMASPLERRRFNRIIVTLPVEYQTCVPNTDMSDQGQGVLRDISLGGTFFVVNPNSSLHVGQVLALTIHAPLPYLEDSDISHLHATGEIVRLEPPSPDHPFSGVALNFLEGPTFCTTSTQDCFTN